MKTILLGLALLGSVALASAPAQAQRSGRSSFGDVYVRPHLRSDGSFVNGHMRSRPDSSFTNNWTTFPNTNPYTGREGTRITPPTRFSWNRF